MSEGSPYRLTVTAHRIQQEYFDGGWTEEQYQKHLQETTALFSQVSGDLLSLISWFRAEGQAEVVRILEDVQALEKEKLQLVMWVCVKDALFTVFLPQTVQHQLKRLEKREKEMRFEEGEEELTVTAHEERELRRKLARTEGAIAGLLDDFKFECEPHLLER